MVETIWTYRVKRERRGEFERRYRSDGDWAKLFARAKGYGGTTLLRDAKEEGRPPKNQFIPTPAQAARVVH